MDLVNEVLPVVLEWMPEVVSQNKSKPLTIKDRMRWTAAILVIYLMMSQVPIFGSFGQASDPFFQQRLLLGSTRGTIMELGISPLLTSGLISTFLSSSSMSSYYESEKASKSNPAEKRKREKKLQKFLGIVLCFFQAAAYVLSGMYGKLDVLGSGNAIMIVIQLSLSGIFVIFFDESLSLGYGVVNSGVSLFIATNICADVVWKAFSPVTVFISRKGVVSDFVGVFPAAVKCIYQAASNPKKGFSSLPTCFFDRGSGLPTLSNLLGTVIIVLIISYIRNCQFELSLHKKTILPWGRGILKFPVRILYTGNMPIILFISFINNIFIISQNMSIKYKKVALVKILGVWKSVADNSDVKIPISGLSYYLTPPTSLYNGVIKDPTHFLIYTVLVLVSCVFFSFSWVEISNSNAKAVTKQLKEQNLVLKGYKENNNNTIEKVLGRLIPSATAMGGVCLGLIYILSDLLGALGSGSGLLLAVSTISECLEVVALDPDFAFFA